MSVDPATGRLTWTPTSASPADAQVVLQVYDARGGSDEQSFTIHVAGGNHAPVFAPVPPQIIRTEGQPLVLQVQATDADGNALLYWADDLPGGARFDPAAHALYWTPSFDQAGTYEEVLFSVTDGVVQASTRLTILVTPANRPPELDQPPTARCAKETISDSRSRAATSTAIRSCFRAPPCPAGATLDPLTGAFDWQVGFAQAGVLAVPFTVSDGTASVTRTATFTVLNANAAR